VYKNDHFCIYINTLQIPFEVIIDLLVFFPWDNYHQTLHKLFLDHRLHLRKNQHHHILNHCNQESLEIIYLHLKYFLDLPLCYLHLKCFQDHI
jgi:hypothetical protein